MSRSCEPMDKILTYKGAVMTWECDSNRHMNVMYYINKFEHAGRGFDLELQFFKDGGRHDHLGIVVLQQQINYIKEVFEDDLLYVESQLQAIGNKSFTVFHEMKLTRTQELVATMKAVLVRFNKETRKSLPFPEDRRKELSDRWNLD